MPLLFVGGKNVIMINRINKVEIEYTEEQIFEGEKKSKEDFPELYEYATNVKEEKGLKAQKLIILIGPHAKEYARNKGLKAKTMNGYFDYENVETPVILILKPSSWRVKSTIHHEMTHFDQYVKKTLVPVSSNKKVDYYLNVSEIEAFENGLNGFSEKEWWKKFKYNLAYKFDKLYYTRPILRLVLIIFIVLFLASVELSFFALLAK